MSAGPRPGVTLMLVFANAVSPEQEQAFDDWYTRVHIPELLRLGGLSSTRYRALDDSPAGAPPAHRHLAVHELPSERLHEVAAATRAAQADGRMGITPAFDLGSAAAYYFEPITERITRDRAPAMLADPRYQQLKATEQPAVVRLRDTRRGKMTEGPIEYEAGGYAYLPGRGFASGGVIALPGRTFARVVLELPVALEEGFRLIERHLRQVGRPLTALCGIEIRSPRALPAQGFRDFNSIYNAQLEQWGLMDEDRVPLARTNVAPAAGGPPAPSLFGFAYTVEEESAHPALIISGAAEIADDGTYPDDIVRAGETSAEALDEKIEAVIGIVDERLRTLGTSWDEGLEVHFYSALPIAHRAGELLAARGLVPAHGIVWHPASPPVEDFALEIDVRRSGRELHVDQG